MASGFVSEKVLDEKRKERQAEWEKVRKADDPQLAPEEPHENRSLFDQLQANKMKAQEEWDESHKLKNQIRGIDDDEAEFLDEVDRFQIEMERKIVQEEQKELEEYRKHQDKVREQQLEERLKSERIIPVTKNDKTKSTLEASSSKSKLLAGIVKRAEKRENPAKLADSGAKVMKEENSSNLGALAGLGDYDSSSSSEEEKND